MLSRSWAPRLGAGNVGVSLTGVAACTGSGYGTSSGTIFSMRVASRVTSPPLRRVRITDCPAFLCPLTDTVRPEDMITISADARDTQARVRTHVAAATRTVWRTFIGTEDPTIWLAGLSRNATAQLGSEVRGSRFEVRGPRFEVRGSRFDP